MFLIVVVVLVPLLLVVAAELQSEDVLWIEVAEVFRTPLQLRDPRLMIRAPRSWPGPGVRVPKFWLGSVNLHSARIAAQW